MIGAPLGVRLDLRGECNRCGLCCVQDAADGSRVVCEYLAAELPARPLGHPLAARCLVYERRQSGMVIRMLNGRGEVAVLSRCWQDTWQEDHAVVARIGQGCSYTLPVSEGQVTAFTPARRP